MALLLMKPTIIALIVQLSLIIISSIISLSKCDQTTETTSNTNGNITTIIDLHHSDLSPRSPRYDPSLSHYQRIANALQRSSNRRNLASKQTPSAAPTIENNDGYYFLDYSIGINPSVTLQGVLSTASDLIWTPCSNLNRSTSLKPIPCNTPRCNSLLGSFCDRKRRCSYNMRYGDGSSYKVYLFTDTITLASSVQFPNITFGCGTNNQGSDGFVGLGGGAVSLVKQIGIGKFSYCLVSYKSTRTTSKLHLGDSTAVVPGVPIPFYIGQDPASYKVKLASITVAGGQKKKPVTTLPFGKNMILDTGTGSTFLPRFFYNTLLDTLRSSIGTDNVTDPHGTFDLCYSSEPGNKFPDITLKFENNVDVKWKQENVFAPLDQNTWCFAAFWIDDDEEAILGNLAQVNFWVGFDLNKNTVTIQPKDCGQQ